MKSPLNIAAILTIATLTAAHADSITFIPDGFPDPNDGSVWNIDVTTGSMGAGTYEGWCFSDMISGYDAGADFGHTFTGVSTTDINSVSFYGAHSGNQMAGALVNYLYQNYYGFWNGTSPTGASTSERYNAFHNLLWEIGDDYDPAVGVGSLSLSAGNFDTLSYTSPSDTLLMSAITGVFPSLSPTYTSTSFNLHVIEPGGLSKDGSPLGYDKQPLVLAVPVPEPTAPLLTLAVEHSMPPDAAGSRAIPERGSVSFGT